MLIIFVWNFESNWGWPMSKADLQDWLIENSGFQDQFRRLVIDFVANQFRCLTKSNVSDVHGGHDWKYLLLCASLLAQSNKGVCQDTALRIAQNCLECSDTTDIHKDSAAIILDTLANRPAIRLAENRKLIKGNFTGRLPLTLLQDWTRRSFENSITLSNSISLEVNRFQRRFWKEATANDWVSISAPTSAGKSFIVGQWLADYLRIHPLSNVVYIVPTRALIQQVQRDIEGLLQLENIDDVSVSTLPLCSSIVDGKSNVFVFTQERFHILLGEHAAEISFNLLVVDEAQKIGDSNRGVLLQQAIESAVFRNPQCRVLFASPMTENPGIFLEDAPDNVSTTPLVSEDSMVNQNLIWVSQVPNQPSDWNVELIIASAPFQIGTIKLPARPTSTSKRLPFVAFSLGNPKGGNVVYVNGPADAEKAAKQLYDLVGDNPELAADTEINELIDLIKKTIHKKYTLWNVLLRGIAFHYGNMPLLVRTEIERLFSSNKIKYLVCTSTLIEGINMPCQSIFVRGPSKGRGKPMTSSDFWNLAGRAGRWGKEFQGNVVCVDARQKDVWKLGAPTGRTKYRISRTSDEVLNQSVALLSFIDNRSPRDDAAKHPNLEYVFSYLVSSYLRNGSIAQTIWARRFPAELVSTLDVKIVEIVERLRTPPEVVLRNPGISPIAMDDLLEYFHDRTENRNEPVEGLIPVPPESNDAVNEYAKVLHRMNRYFGKEFGWGDKRVRQLALLIVDWMKGFPLARIISSREQFYKNRGDSTPTAKLIRDTMADVEGVARFKAPKYLACYVDLLRVYLARTGRDDLLERLLELNILLEFGVSQTTQLSLMGLGLSRSTAISISEIITDDSLNEAECIQWLEENNWMTEDMPEIIKCEISNLISKKTKKDKII